MTLGFGLGHVSFTVFEVDDDNKKQFYVQFYREFVLGTDQTRTFLRVDFNLMKVFFIQYIERPATYSNA